MNDKIGFFEDAPNSFSMGRLQSFILVLSGVVISLLAATYLVSSAEDNRVAVGSTLIGAGFSLIIQGLGAKAFAKSQEIKEDRPNG